MLSNVPEATRYSLLIAGESLGASAPQGMAFGFATVCVLFFTLRSVMRERETWRALLPFTAAVLLAALSLVPLTSGRLALGVTVPYYHSTRYVPLASLWPIGAYMAMLACRERHEWRQPFKVFTAILCVGILLGYADGFSYARRFFAEQQACQAVLAHYRTRSDEEVRCYYPNPTLARIRAFWLDQLHLSIFRNRK